MWRRFGRDSSRLDLFAAVRHIPCVAFVQGVWAFLRVRKKFWLLPIIVFLFGFGILIVFSRDSAIAPFNYTLF